MNNKEALEFLRKISAAFDELNELWDNATSYLDSGASTKS